VSKNPFENKKSVDTYRLEEEKSLKIFANDSQDGHGIYAIHVRICCCLLHIFSLVKEKTETILNVNSYTYSENTIPFNFILLHSD
jgi:hypothetical protein